MSTQKKLWAPTADSVSKSAITHLARDLGFSNYAELHRWSIENPGLFWSRVWDDARLKGIKGDRAYVPGDDFISAKFFPDAQINVTENILGRGNPEDVAIISLNESSERIEITWSKLSQLVAATAAAMRAEGIVKGDRVVAWAPNAVEVVVYSLAGLSIGAVISTASPDFAPPAVADRFGQIEPKLLLAASSYSYGGKTFDCAANLEEIVKSLPTVKKIVLIAPKSSEHQSFGDWIAPFMGAPLVFEPLLFDHPGFILFSSGTTGKPKCIVHSGAGILLKLSGEFIFQLEFALGDRTFFYTTTGWMMWNWLIYALSTGATVVLYDGSPVYPTAMKMFEIAESEKLTFLGLSAKFIDSCRKDNLTTIGLKNLSSLRTIASTGSVLAPESFDYVYQSIKKDVRLVSMSGGTDICGCFLGGVPTLPVHSGELQGPCLGMAATVYTGDGSVAADDIKGELVCTVPFPSKPLGFWNDSENSRYKAAYFEGFPNVWTQGDFASISSTGGFTLYGRSDATLNSKGVRIGTAEIYRVVETFNEIQESIAVSQDWDNDTRVVLFVTMKNGNELTDELVTQIKSALRKLASPRHVPDVLLCAPELPRTKSNKLVELAVTDAINGREIRNVNSLANPKALDWFKNNSLLK